MFDVLVGISVGDEQVADCAGGRYQVDGEFPARRMGERQLKGDLLDPEVVCDLEAALKDPLVGNGRKILCCFHDHGTLACAEIPPT